MDEGWEPVSELVEKMSEAKERRSKILGARTSKECRESDPRRPAQLLVWSGQQGPQLGTNSLRPDESGTKEPVLGIL